MVVDASNFSEAITINSLEFFFAPGATDNQVVFFECYVYMGYCSSSELSTNYDSNYINGWKYTVYERTSPVVFLSSDPVINFDTPFFYNPSQGNLVFEIAWPDAAREFYVYNNVEATNTLVYGPYSSETGDQYMERPHLLIHGELALDQTTFAGIKASF